MTISKNKILKTLLIIALLAISGLGIFFIVNTLNNAPEINILNEDDSSTRMADLGAIDPLIEMSESEYDEMLKSNSDIEGMTKAEKLSAGMFPEDNSDSDYDGLTDKEEIEIYGN